nr:hypothetical protein [Solirubrobacterales bacterium]
MTEPRAQRTLVKSPPELWAEISDPDALTRRLSELGEIRITRLEPESTVAWEGDRVRGTVELEASGWGTKVTLTAQSTAPDPVPTVVEEEAAPVAAPARAAAPLEPEGSASPAPESTPATSRNEPLTKRVAAGRRPGLLSLFRRRPRGSAPTPVAD